MWKIENTDVLSGLRSLADGSVHCCVTSPPYWGLRDYGTATWEGGDTACDHRPPDDAGVTNKPTAGQREHAGRYSGPKCWKCGARRIDKQIGLEKTPDEYIANMVEVFREVKRVLRPDGTCWVNMGDGYASGEVGRHDRSDGVGCEFSQNRTSHGKRQSRKFDTGLKPKDLIGMPWRLAFSLQADGWWLRSEIIWHKRSPMPESVRDRPTKAHEQIFLLTKSARYFYDAVASIEQAKHGRRSGGFRADKYLNNKAFNNSHDNFETMGSHTDNPETGRNMRSVWTLSPEPFSGWVETVRRVRVAEDDADDGTTRITSPDCPIHGSKDRRHPIRVDGERGGDGDFRTGDTCGHPVQEQAGERESIDQSHASDSEKQSSDSLFPTCSVSATGRSKRKSKKARALATNQPCTVSDETTGRTGDKPASPENCEPCDHKHESNNGPDDSADPLSAGKPHHTEGTFSISCPPKCTCEYYREITEKSSHFATFPTELVRKCLLAGTSEKGCCPECGSFWRRVVERGADQPQIAASTLDRFGTGDAGVHRKVGSQYQKWLDENPKKTTGWQSGCSCGKEPIGCLVLDPFAGAGTTIMVARRMQCRAIGFELNPKYVAMATKRITADAPLFNS